MNFSRSTIEFCLGSSALALLACSTDPVVESKSSAGGDSEAEASVQGDDAGASDPAASGDDDEGSSGGAEEGDDGDTESGSTDPGETGESDASSDAETVDSAKGGDLPRFDLGVIPDAVPPREGCQKIDFLFVIDNSGSMADEQDNLIRSFPRFMETIETSLKISDVHIMAVDTDEAGGDDFLCKDDGDCICLVNGGCCERACLSDEAITCEGVACPDEATCGVILGAGNVQDGVDNADCMLASEARYITSEQADLAGTFACTANMGIHGNGDERPMQAMTEAVGPSLTAPGECNAGFVREDAILVVVVITDEDDVGKSTGDPKSWKRDLIASKFGDESAVVVLGLIGDLDLPMDEAACIPFQDPNQTVGAEPCPVLREFVQSFGDRGIAGSVCADDYAPFFDEAVAIIDDTCTNFDPPDLP